MGRCSTKEPRWMGGVHFLLLFTASPEFRCSVAKKGGKAQGFLPSSSKSHFPRFSPSESPCWNNQPKAGAQARTLTTETVCDVTISHSRAGCRTLSERLKRPSREGTCGLTHRLSCGLVTLRLLPSGFCLPNRSQPKGAWERSPYWPTGRELVSRACRVSAPVRVHV